VAGVILSTIGKTGIYLFGATSNVGMGINASNLLQWHSIQMLKRLGCDYYDLCSINRARNPGTYHFKAGLCGRNGVESGVSQFECLDNQFNALVARVGCSIYSALRG
jgi:lipid II:glycine glycyltransferase (peptidoglycan interpeptide bridge formation enzyme)